MRWWADAGACAIAVCLGYVLGQYTEATRRDALEFSERFQRTIEMLRDDSGEVRTLNRLWALTHLALSDGNEVF